MLNKIEYTVRPDQLNRMELFDNRRKHLSIIEVQRETGADVVFPGPYFDDFQPVVHCKINGLELCRPDYTDYGVIITDGKPHQEKIPDDNALTYWGNDMLIISGQKRDRKIMHIHPDGYERHGRAVVMGLQDGSLLFRCTRNGGTDARTVLEEQDIAHKKGTVWAVNNDGGNSACCITPGGNLIYNDHHSDAPRKMPVYILVYLNKPSQQPTEDTRTAKPTGKTVYIDAGHYTGCPNGNDTLGYKEDELALDLSKRLGRLLEQRGIKVYQTRKGDEYVGLSARHVMANKIKDLDLFVSLHSNANPKKSCDGFGVLIYGKGGNGEKTAKAILDEAKKQKITLWGSGLFVRPGLSVLRNTLASAVLIEHGFHSNTAECWLLKSDDYRDKLAEIDARGICEALGIAWVPVTQPEVPDNLPNVDDDVPPAHREAVAWCKERGITDGSRINESPTKAEICSMIFRAQKGD